MFLTKHSLYSAFLTGEEMIEACRNPQKDPPRHLRRMDATSMEYYMELYRQSNEKDGPIREPSVPVPALVLLLSDVGTMRAEILISALSQRDPAPKIFALCTDPSAYATYMNYCDRVLFASDEDANHIREALGQALNASGLDLSVIRYGRLCLYADERDGYLYGKKLYLTPAEYHILRFLTFHQGAFFNADSIMAYCFPSTFARKRSNAVTHICRINQKAERMTGEKIISCKKQAGYFVIKK